MQVGVLNTRMSLWCGGVRRMVLQITNSIDMCRGTGAVPFWWKSLFLALLSTTMTNRVSQLRAINTYMLEFMFERVETLAKDSRRSKFYFSKVIFSTSSWEGIIFIIHEYAYTHVRLYVGACMLSEIMYGLKCSRWASLEKWLHGIDRQRPGRSNVYVCRVAVVLDVQDLTKILFDERK